MRRLVRERWPVAVQIALRQSHQQIQDQGHGHQHAGAQQDGLHIILTDAGGDEAAQSTAPHEGGKDRGADGVDRGDADAGEDDGGGQGELHMEQAVHPGHAHAPAGLDEVLRHLAQAQVGVPYDGQQGVEGQTDDDGGLARPHEDHDDAQKGQGGGGLDQVHHPEHHPPGGGVEVAQDAQWDAGQNGKDQGGHHKGQMSQDHGEGHVAEPPFRSPLGTVRRWSRSTRVPRAKASRAAGMAPSRIRALSLELRPA